MIELSSLKKSFGEVHAVSDVSLLAQDGEVTGLLGPNGAGKTTTLRMLTGLLRPDAGKINNIDVHQNAGAARKLLGVLPDARGLYPRLSTREHIEYFARLNGMSKSEIDERIKALTHSLGLESILDRRVHGFSQGQRVKVALSRVLVHSPQNIVLDEPTNGLDVGATRAMRRLIRAFKAEGRCVVFSSHIMQEVRALCDKIVVVAEGRVVASGSADELREASGCDDLEDAFVKLTGIDDA